VAGYYFQQITDDSGPGAKLGGFRGMAVGIGPQIGFLFPVGDFRVNRPLLLRRLTGTRPGRYLVSSR